LGIGKLGKCHEPPVHATMQPPEKSGAERSWGGAATPPWDGPLATALLWWVPGWAWMAPSSVLGPYLVVGWAFA